MTLCDICVDNNHDLEYRCCQKKVCRSCYDNWYNINKTCPFCRSIVIKTLDDCCLLNKFNLWIKDNDINLGSNLEKMRLKVKNIDDIFNNKKNSEKVLLQVATPNLIHVFKYHSKSQIDFKYHEDYNLVEVRGGEYYLYGKLESSEVFYWWLHSFIGETHSIGNRRC